MLNLGCSYLSHILGTHLGHIISFVNMPAGWHYNLCALVEKHERSIMSYMYVHNLTKVYTYLTILCIIFFLTLPKKVNKLKNM